MSGNIEISSRSISRRVAKGVLRRSTPASTGAFESVEENRGSAISKILKRAEGRLSFAVHCDDFAIESGEDRWWVCTYDGDVNVSPGPHKPDIDAKPNGDYHVPIGKCLIKFGERGELHREADGKLVFGPNNQSYAVGLLPNWDDSPGARLQLSVKRHD